MPTAKTRKSTARAVGAAKSTPRLTFAQVMRELEQAGSAQARKTYARHGAPEPMFGVSFATLKVMRKRIGVDHELGLALWASGNFDARNLAVKIIDPARMQPGELDRWAGGGMARLCGGYVEMVAAEGPHARDRLAAWLGAKAGPLRGAGWTLLGQLAQRDEGLPDAVFAERLAEIERTIRTAPNDERYAMNMAVIAIGGRSAGLRRAALAAARRIGVVEVDHGDTDCKTPDAAEYITKAWAHAKDKGHASPAAQERARETRRLRC